MMDVWNVIINRSNIYNVYAKTAIFKNQIISIAMLVNLHVLIVTLIIESHFVMVFFLYILIFSM